MASQKLSALVNLAGGQVPTDLAYIVDVSAGAAGSKRSTLNDFLSTITKNITDGALRFQGFAAPALSGAGEGAIYFDSTANAFRISENAGAYRAIGDVLLTAVQTLTNKTITAATNVLGGVTMTLGGDAEGDIYYRNLAGQLTRLAIGGVDQVLTVVGGLPSWQNAAETSPGGAAGQVQYNSGAGFGGITGFTSDGTNVTAGSGNLRATSPRITTSIFDANGLAIIGLSPAAIAVNQFTIANAAAGNAPTLSATGTDAAINITISPKSTGFLQSTGPLQLSGTGTINFTTPVGNSVPTKIDVPLFNPGAFSQIIAVGLDSAAASSARVICAFDQRAAGHQPSIALQAPDENNIFGMTWDGQNNVGFLSSTTSLLGFLGTDAYFGNGQINAAPTSYVLNATGGSGTDIAGANLDLAGGKGTGNAEPGFVAVRYPLRGGSGTTLQSLSTDSYPVNTSLYNLIDSPIISNTAAETSFFTGATTAAGSTRTIEAGITKAGTVYRVRGFGNVTNTGTPTLQIRVKLGGSTIADTTATTMAAITGVGRFWLEFDILVGSIGATGTIAIAPLFRYSTTASGALTLNNIGIGATDTIDFTTSQTIDITVQFGAADPANAIELLSLTIERIR